MAEVCEQNPRCVFDGNAAFRWLFEARHITTTDYVHFSIAGQAALADLTFPLAFAPPRATQPRPAGSAPTPRRSSAKLKVKRASLPSGRLNVLLGITGRATGKLQIKLEAGGRTSFSVDVGSSGSKEKQVRIDRPLPVAGTVDPRVDGSVRLRVTYTRSNGTFAAFNRTASISKGRWSTDETLPPSAVADAAAYLTTQYTGDGNTRGGPYRGEQQGKLIGGL